MTSVAAVNLWGRRIGAVALEDGQAVAAFEYDRGFQRSGIEVAPLAMPLSEQVYRFPSLEPRSFRGLPGLLADSLPDRFGNALIDQWLATQGRRPESFNAVERLCYTGTRGMGALEYEPARGPDPRTSSPVDIASLAALAQDVLSRREGLAVALRDAPAAGNANAAALQDILRVGTSAGGARAKAIVAWNESTNEVRSGQVAAGPGFGYWLLKFDGVAGNRDKELVDPLGYGAIEYAYALMARDAGIVMAQCRLLEENGRRHFMTKRFDRTADGGKLHMQSLAALAHYDFNAAGEHSYEQAIQATRRLGLGMDAIEQQFRRMVFNIVARNQDDHVKNIAFLMDRQGRWSLSPAFDVTYAYNPDGAWTGSHQMSMNAKRDQFTRADFKACASTAGLKRGRDAAILDEVIEAVSSWRRHAKLAGVPGDTARQIARAHRLQIE